MPQLCAACNTENPDSAKFCSECGARLSGVVAPAPASAASADSTAPVSPPSPARNYTPRHLSEKILQNRAAMVGERKRVTVMFADIKGSTVLAEQAGAEAWHNMLDRYFAILGAAVHKFEGTVNQYTGDGIMALFGAPLALEDHAQRACMAALEAQQEVRRYADELRLSTGLNLSMRIGLNSGEVIVGRIGDDLRMDYTAQGHTVNLAARLEHICEPGSIYCSRSTAVLVEGYFKLRDLGKTQVAGVTQPVQVYDVEGVGATASRLERALAMGAAPFIGREQELRTLHAALEQVRSGGGRIVALVGEAGIGKSRLCQQFADDCIQRGIALHRASGVPYAAAVPLLPIQNLLRSRLGVPEGASIAQVRQLAAGSLMLLDPQAADLLPALLTFLGAGEIKARLDVGADRERLFGFLSFFLAHSGAPQVLLVEDLHFADPATEACLAALARQIADSQTLLLLNFRPGYEAPWLDTVEHQCLPVERFDDAAMMRLAEGLLGRCDGDCPLTRELLRRASGNPYFVEEAIQALLESGHLAGSRGNYHVAKEITEWPVADTVHSLLAARIDRLDDALKQLLQTASVIGSRFTARQLADVWGLDREACADGLSQLVRARFLLVPERADGDYQFNHPLMLDVAYGAQLEKLRTATHLRIAALLESKNPITVTPTAEAVRVAHHLRRAGEWLRAGAWNLHAARFTIMNDARTTIQQLRLAIENLAKAPASVETDHLRVLAHAGLIRQGPFADVSHEEIVTLYVEGARIAEERGDAAGKVELLISLSGDKMRGGDARGAVTLALEAVEFALEKNVTEVIGRFRLLLLLAASSAGYPREGIAVISKAGGAEWCTGPVNDNNYLSRGLYGYMLGWIGKLDEGCAHMREALAHAEKLGASASWMYANQVEVALLTGEHAGILDRAQIALQRADAFGSPYFRAIAMRSLGLAHVLQGNPATAVTLLEEARQLVTAGANAHQFEASTLATLARAYAAVGEPGKAFDTSNAAIASAQHSHSLVWEILAWLPLFELPANGPWAARAREGLVRVESLLATTGAESARPWWWLARERWDADPAVRAIARSKALEAFAQIGAPLQVRRFSEQAA